MGMSLYTVDDTQKESKGQALFARQAHSWLIAVTAK
jgi:hypothetical protein